MEELQKIYKKEGSDFINDLLNDYVIVTEKLSGSSFVFEKHGDELQFFKGNGHKPISLVDRTMMMYYEPPIRHITQAMESAGPAVPDNWRFCFQYFVHNEPGVIKYSMLPKNNLVLTHIHVKGENGKTAKIIDDPRVIADWARELNVTPLRPFFVGHLDSEQQEKIKEFITVPIEDQEELFGTESFAEYIMQVLNPGVTATTLHGDLKSPIDSLVFKFVKPGSGRSVSAKIIDPYTRTLMKQKEPVDLRRAPADMNEIVLLDLLAFIEERGIKQSDAMSGQPEERYVELVSGLFNDYVAQHGDELEGVRFDKADFATGPEFDLNLDMIQNAKTKELVSGSSGLADLYKVMLGSLRKKRDESRTGSVMTPSVVRDFNKMIDKIDSIVNKQDGGEFKTFDEYLKMKQVNESFEDPIESLSEERVLNFSQFANLEKVDLNEALNVPYKERGKQKVNMIVGRFQPFTLGHAKVFKQIHDQNGLPVVVFTVRGKKPNPEKSPFSEETQQAMFAKMQKEYPFLEAMYVAPSAGIDTLYSMMRPAYEPVLWGFGTDRKKAYEYMINKPEYREQLDVDPDFKGYEIKRGDEDISASKVRQAIKLDDEKTFKRMTPKSIHDMYSVLQDVLEPVMESSGIESVTEDLVKVQIGNDEVGEVDSTDSDSIDSIRRIASTSSIKSKLNAFLDELGVPKKHQGQVINILSFGDVNKIADYVQNRTLKINNLLNKSVNAISITERLLGLSSNAAKSMFEYQWPTTPIMGKGEFWLGMMLDGGSLKGVGDVTVNGDSLEVKGIGARLVGQKGYGNAQQIPQAYTDALVSIAAELGANNYEPLRGKNIDLNEWNITKKDGRLLSSNLELIANEIGGFDKKAISLISRKLVEAYRVLYINLNAAKYSDILQSSIDRNGKINANEFNLQLLKMAFEYYHQTEHFKYFAIINTNSGTLLVIEPNEFSRLVDSNAISYNPPRWGPKAGPQGGHYAISIK